MSTGAPIRVDPASLTDLAGQIEAVVAHFRTVQATFEGHGSALQSRQIEDALHDFNADWSDKRGKLEESLDGAASSLRKGAAQFEAADRGLADQANGTTPP